MSNAAAAITGPKKRRRFGRPDVVRPLAGLDMRSQEAKAFMARLAEVTAEYPNGEPGRLREIAGLRLTLEQVQVEVMKGSSRARDDLVRISNLKAYPSPSGRINILYVMGFAARPIARSARKAA